MNQESSIYCRAEIIKDPLTSRLRLSIHLDPDAPNLTQDSYGIIWTPNEEERSFIKDACSLFPDPDHFPKIPSNEKIQQNLTEEQTTQSSPNPSIDAIEETINKHRFFSNKEPEAKDIIERIVDKQSNTTE